MTASQCRPSSQEKLTTSLINYGWGNNIKYRVNAGANTRFPQSAFIRVDELDEISGVQSLCTGWHSVGHPVSQTSAGPTPPPPRGTDIPTLWHEPPHPYVPLVRSISASCDLLLDLTELMELDNLVLQHIDHEAHRMLTELRQKSDDIGSSKAFQLVDSSLFPSHFMLFNCQTKKHLDEKDHPQL
jgi:hypothetical protein